MRSFWQSYEGRISVLFSLLLIIYLAIAYWLCAPAGYYGTIDEPRFSDPWIARTETIINGGLLYRDVFTATPPLTNFLIVPPTLVAKLFGYKNPWATLSFMLYFSLFNLLAAYILLYLGKTPSEGWRAAVAFLLNPLTFSNAVLRRQDESILVLFFALSLLLLLKRRHLQAAIAIGATLLVKLSGVLLMPVAFLHSRDWKYLLIPVLVFAIAFTPFLIMAGKEAIFWDFGQKDTQHPFQLGGISLGSLWDKWHGGDPNSYVSVLSALFLLGAIVIAAFIAWKRFGVLEDTTIVIAIVLLLTPKLHAGYFSVLALTMAPLLKNYRLGILYFLTGTLVIVADFFKFPIRNYPLAFALMAAVSILLLAIVFRLCQPKRMPQKYRI